MKIKIKPNSNETQLIKYQPLTYYWTILLICDGLICPSLSLNNPFLALSWGHYDLFLMLSELGSFCFPHLIFCNSESFLSWYISYNEILASRLMHKSLGSLMNLRSQYLLGTMMQASIAPIPLAILAFDKSLQCEHWQILLTRMYPMALIPFIYQCLYAFITKSLQVLPHVDILEQTTPNVAFSFLGNTFRMI